MKSKSAFHPFVPIGIFFFGALAAAFLVQNLPFKFGDEMNIIYRVRHASWAMVLQALGNPFASAWYIHGGESLFVSRIFQAFLFKALFTLFGYSPNAFWSLNVLSFAACGTLIFLFLFFLTKNQWLGASGSLFFYLLPPVFRCISWVADPEITAQAFVLVSFLVFLRLYTAPQDRGKSNVSAFLLLVVSSWLGMRLKETARIIPIVFVGFLLLHQNRNLLGWLRENKRNQMIAGISLFLLTTVIPWKTPEGLRLDPLSHTAIFRLDPTNFIMILSQLGPILLPVLLSLTVGMALGRTKPSCPPAPLLFLAIWIGLCLLGYSMNFQLEGNIRYLTTAMVPLTLFFFTLLAKLLERVASFRPRWGKPIAACLIGFPLFFQTNFDKKELHINFKIDEILFIRNFHIGTDIAEYFLILKVYEDRFGKGNPSWQELDDFYRGKPPAEKGEFTAIRVKHWDPHEDPSPANLRKIAEKWGAAYVLSFEGGRYSDEPRVKQIGQITTANQSLYSLILGKVKKKTHRAAYLYKFTP